MLVGRGEESSTRATISSLMALITNSSRSDGGQPTNEHSAHKHNTPSITHQLSEGQLLISQGLKIGAAA